MNLTNPFNSELARVSDWINRALEALMARINAVWNVEHDADGTHRDITADSLTITASTNEENAADNPTGDADIDGDVTIGGDLSVDGLVGPLDFGTEADAIVLDGVFHGPDTEEDRSGWPSVGVTADVIVPLLRTTRGVAPSADNLKDLGYLSNGTAHLRFRSGYFGSYVEAPVVHSTTALYERARSTPVGEWIAVSHAAGNFTASAGTWTVEAADQTTFRYTLIGKTLIVAVTLDNTSTGAGMGTQLRVTIPSGFTAAATTSHWARTVDAGTEVTGRVVVTGTTIIFVRLDGAAWGSSATNTTQVAGTFSFEVA